MRGAYFSFWAPRFFSYTPTQLVAPRAVTIAVAQCSFLDDLGLRQAGVQVGLHHIAVLARRIEIFTG